jgi:hypothetical protein
VIRLGRPEDAPGVAALLAELGYPGGSVGQVRDHLARWTGAGNAVVLVAEHAGRLAGAVAVAAIPYFEHDGSWGRIVARFGWQLRDARQARQRGQLDRRG